MTRNITSEDNVKSKFFNNFLLRQTEPLNIAVLIDLERITESFYKLKENKVRIKSND